MRFVIGVFCGAGLLFAAVAASGTGSTDLSGRLPDWLDDLAVGVGDWLSLPPRPDDAAGERLERLPALDMAGRRAADDVDDARERHGAPDPGEPNPASEPIPRPPDPHPVDDVADESPGATAAMDGRPTTPSGSRDEDVQALVAEIFGPRDASSPAPTAGSGADGDVVAALTGPAGGSGSQAIWVPFHSQMSAAGFASRLSESLGHPFDVERQGPGRYQVVFAYADESERAALLEEATAVTGLPL